MRYVAALAILLCAGSALAQSPEAATAESAQLVYDEGKREMEKGDYAHACPRFKAVKKLLPSHVRTRITLAECYAKTDKPASAWGELSEALELATQQADKAKIEEINARLAEIKPATPMLTIKVPQRLSELEGFALKLDGESLARMEWGQPLPVDYGIYTIDAVAVDKAPWSKRVTIDHSSKQFSVAVEPGWSLPGEAPKISEPSGSTTRNPTPRQPHGPVERRPEPSSSTWRPLGAVAISAGGVGIAAGIIVGLVAISKKNASNDGHCLPDNHCDQTGFDLRKEAISLAGVSTGVFVAGVLLMGGGLTVQVLTKPSAPSRTTSLHDGSRVTLGLGAGNVFLGGTF